MLKGIDRFNTTENHLNKKKSNKIKGRGRVKK